MTDAPVLVVGYGSELRSDDAAGRRVAEAVAALRLPGVRVLSLPQLAPEVADDVEGCSLVVFVDAGVNDQEVTVRTVPPARPDWRLTHAFGPSSVLALAATATGTAPAAAIVTLPAHDFSLGDRLSSATAGSVGQAVAQVVALCRDRGTAAP